MTEGSPVERLDWLRAIVLQCSGKAARIAAALESRWNRQAGCAWPSHAQLAADARVSEDTVIRAVRELVAAGFLVVERPQTQGRGWANEYRPVWEAGSPRRTATLSGEKPPQNCDPLDEKGGAELRPKGGQSCGERGGRTATPTQYKNPVKEPGGTRERANPPTATASGLDLFDQPSPEAQAAANPPRRRSLGDLQAVHSVLVVFREDRDRAHALVDLYGWESCSEVLTELEPIARKREPGKQRVLVSELGEALAKNYTLERDDYERAGLPVPAGVA